MTQPVIGIGADLGRGEADREHAFAYLTYVKALNSAGAVALVVPPQREFAGRVVESLDGLVLAGGFDCDPAMYGRERHPSCELMDPRRQEGDLALAAAARSLGVPTLGICLGMQVMNVAAGGTLIQDISSEVESALTHSSHPLSRLRHEVRIEAGTRLAELIGAGVTEVNSSHHQAVEQPGRGLRVTAYAPDGVAEALEAADHPFYIGVQWHPEDMTGEQAAAGLFGAFIEAARRHAAGRSVCRT